MLHLQLRQLRLFGLDALLQVLDRNILDFCTFHLVVSLDCGFDVVTPYDKLGGNRQFLGTQTQGLLRDFQGHAFRLEENTSGSNGRHESFGALF